MAIVIPDPPKSIVGTTLSKSQIDGGENIPTEEHHMAIGQLPADLNAVILEAEADYDHGSDAIRNRLDTLALLEMTTENPDVVEGFVNITDTILKPGERIELDPRDFTIDGTGYHIVTESSHKPVIEANGTHVAIGNAGLVTDGGNVAGYDTFELIGNIIPEHQASNVSEFGTISATASNSTAWNMTRHQDYYKAAPPATKITYTIDNANPAWEDVYMVGLTMTARNEWSKSCPNSYDILVDDVVVKSDNITRVDWEINNARTVMFENPVKINESFAVDIKSADPGGTTAYVRRLQPIFGKYVKRKTVLKELKTDVSVIPIITHEDTQGYSARASTTQDGDYNPLNVLMGDSLGNTGWRSVDTDVQAFWEVNGLKCNVSGLRIMRSLVVGAKEVFPAHFEIIETMTGKVLYITDKPYSLGSLISWEYDGPVEGIRMNVYSNQNEKHNDFVGFGEIELYEGIYVEAYPQDAVQPDPTNRVVTRGSRVIMPDLMTANSSVPSTPVGNVLDISDTTEWRTTDEQTMSYIDIDLGITRNLGDIDVRLTDMDRSKLTSVEVLTSIDGKCFQRLFTETSKILIDIIFSLPPTTPARYVRVVLRSTEPIQHALGGVTLTEATSEEGVLTSLSNDPILDNFVGRVSPHGDVVSESSSLGTSVGSNVFTGDTNIWACNGPGWVQIDFDTPKNISGIEIDLHRPSMNYMRTYRVLLTLTDGRLIEVAEVRDNVTLGNVAHMWSLDGNIVRSLRLEIDESVYTATEIENIRLYDGVYERFDVGDEPMYENDGDSVYWSKYSQGDRSDVITATVSGSSDLGNIQNIDISPLINGSGNVTVPNTGSSSKLWAFEFEMRHAVKITAVQIYATTQLIVNDMQWLGWNGTTWVPLTMVQVVNSSAGTTIVTFDDSDYFEKYKMVGGNTVTSQVWQSLIFKCTYRAPILMDTAVDLPVPIGTSHAPVTWATSKSFDCNFMANVSGNLIVSKRASWMVLNDRLEPMATYTVPNYKYIVGLHGYGQQVFVGLGTRVEVFKLDELGNIESDVQLIQAPDGSVNFGKSICHTGSMLLIASDEDIHVYSISGEYQKSLGMGIDELYDFGSAMTCSGKNIYISAPGATVDDVLYAGTVYVFDTNLNMLGEIKPPGVRKKGYFGKSLMMFKGTLYISEPNILDYRYTRLHAHDGTNFTEEVTLPHEVTYVHDTFRTYGESMTYWKDYIVIGNVNRGKIYVGRPVNRSTFTPRVFPGSQVFDGTYSGATNSVALSIFNYGITDMFIKRVGIFQNY